MAKITRQSQIRVTEDHVSTDFVDGRVVLMDVKEGTYLSLNSVGARVFRLIEGRTRTGDVIDRLVDEYDVDSDRCEREVLALLDELASRGIIEVLGVATP